LPCLYSVAVTLSPPHLQLLSIFEAHQERKKKLRKRKELERVQVVAGG
jgi:hypothetical protein